MKETRIMKVNKVEKELVLVKPKPISNRLNDEMEALCEKFSCTYNTAKARGDSEEEMDILF